MTEQEVFVLADRTLNDVVAKISDDQWDMRMPASFARRGAGAFPPRVDVPGDAPLPVVEFRFARFRSGLTLTETLGR